MKIVNSSAARWRALFAGLLLTLGACGGGVETNFEPRHSPGSAVWCPSWPVPLPAVLHNSFSVFRFASVAPSFSVGQVQHGFPKPIYCGIDLSYPVGIG